MKKLLFAPGLLIVSALGAQQQSLSLPSKVPVHCSAQTNDCSFNAYSNMTAFVIARFASPPGSISGILGETWTQDQCVTFTGACIFHTTFGSLNAGSLPDKLSFSGNQFSDVFILSYDGNWVYDTGNYGTYAAQNSVFPDCVDGQDCPYAWTLPIETEAGNLIISWLDANGAGHIARPGANFLPEARSDVLFIADMIAPTTGVYFGSFTIRQQDGSESGGTHWLAGIAAYKRH